MTRGRARTATSARRDSRRKVSGNLQARSNNSNYSLLRAATSGKASLTVPHPHPNRLAERSGSAQGGCLLRVPRECVVSMRDCVRSARGESGTALGTGQRVKASCVWRGLAQVCESTNQRQSRKSPGAHLVHLTDAQTGGVPCPDNTASSGRAGNQAPRQNLWWARGSCHSPCPPTQCHAVPTCHTVPPQREESAHQSISQSLRSPQSPGLP